MIGIHLVRPSVEFITPRVDPDWVTHASKIIEEAARASHKSEDKITDDSYKEFIKKFLVHESILEHAVFTVKFICSRACSHQLVRHRIASYTQESQRFCDYSNKRHGGSEDKVLNVIMPPMLTANARHLDGLTIFKDENSVLLVEGEDVERTHFRKYVADTMLEHDDFDIEDADHVGHWILKRIDNYEEYLYWREVGVKPEDARYSLVNASKTEVVTTLNFRMWRHVLGHPVFGRALNKHAQWEIKEITLPVLEFFEKEIPFMFGDLRG